VVSCASIPSAANATLPLREPVEAILDATNRGSEPDLEVLDLIEKR
jgi:hypothetical protein